MNKNTKKKETQKPLTEERVIEIVREEIAKYMREEQKQMDSIPYVR